MSKADDAISAANRALAVLDAIDEVLVDARHERDRAMAPIFERVLTNNAPGPNSPVHDPDWELVPERWRFLEGSAYFYIPITAACGCERLLVDLSVDPALGYPLGVSVPECHLTTPVREQMGLAAYQGQVAAVPEQYFHNVHAEGLVNVPGDRSMLPDQYLLNFIRADLWDLYDFPEEPGGD